MKLSELFEGGSIKQQKRKRITFYIICATAALLSLSLLVLPLFPAYIGIRKLVANITAAPQKEELRLDIGAVAEGTVSKSDLLLFSSKDEIGRDITLKTETIAANRSASPPVYYIKLTATFCGTKDAVTALDSMIMAFRKSNSKANPLYISDAYRSSTSQLNNRPEYSLATVFQLQYDSNKGGSNEITGESTYGVNNYTWLYNNAHHYGFITLGGEQADLFKFVGAHHATAMKAESISSLSDYITYLKENTSYEKPLAVQTAKNGNFAIYYISKDASAMLPTTMSYTASETSDGYVIAVKIK